MGNQRTSTESGDRGTRIALHKRYHGIELPSKDVSVAIQLRHTLHENRGYLQLYHSLSRHLQLNFPSSLSETLLEPQNHLDLRERR